MDNPTLCPRLIRLDRPAAAVDLVAGAGTLIIEEIPAGYVAMLEQVTVSGPGIGGSRISLYSGYGDQALPENLIGSVLLGASDPGTAFGDTRPWLFGPENLIVTITGSAGTRAYVRVWQRLHVVEYEAPAHAAPAAAPAPAPAAALEAAEQRDATE